MVPQAVNKLVQRFPNLKVRVVPGLSDDLQDQVDSGRLDAAVLSPSFGIDGTQTWVPMAEEELVMIAAPDVVGEAQLREIKRSYERSVKVPADLARRLARVTSEAQGKWAAARADEDVAAFLKKQGAPEYLEAVTAGGDDDETGLPGMDDGEGSGDALFDQAVALVARDRKASTSYIQRRLQIGYNRAATLIERMESEGVVSQANHVGKREVLVRNPNEEE